MGQYKCLRPKIPVIVAPCVENIFGGNTIADFVGTPPLLMENLSAKQNSTRSYLKGPLCLVIRNLN